MAPMPLSAMIQSWFTAWIKTETNPADFPLAEASYGDDDNPDIPPDSIYYWSDKTFGSDLDNAMLMKASLELLRQAKVL